MSHAMAVADGARFVAGEVWIHTAAAEWQFDGDGDIVLAYPGDRAHDGAWQQVTVGATG